MEEDRQLVQRWDDNFELTTFDGPVDEVINRLYVLAEKYGKDMVLHCDDGGWDTPFSVHITSTSMETDAEYKARLDPEGTERARQNKVIAAERRKDMRELKRINTKYDLGN